MAAVARGLGWELPAGGARALALLRRTGAVERVEGVPSGARWFVTRGRLCAALVEARAELVDRIEAIDRFLATLCGSVNMLCDAKAEYSRGE
jgi:hypothetical protein